MDERRASTNPLDTISKIADVSKEVDYLRNVLPRAARLLGKLAEQDDPFSKMWVRYISGRVIEAEGNPEEAWKFSVQLRTLIYPIAKGTMRVVSDGRMEDQMRSTEKKEVATRMAEIVGGPTVDEVVKINRAERVIGHSGREFFLSYAELLVSTAGQRPSRIKPSPAQTTLRHILGL